MFRKKRMLKFLCYACACYVLFQFFVIVMKFFSQLFDTKDFVSYCGGNFVGYQRKYARLVNAVIDPSKAHGKVGGEKLSDVLNQSETEEYFKFSGGYVTIVCNETFYYPFRRDVHLSEWRSVLESSPKMPPFTRSVKGWTIAVTRFEYANLYHTATDFYNTFKVMKLFNISLSNLTILWVDAHPLGILDETWSVLFNQVVRAGSIEETVRFENLIWGISGYDSDLSVRSSVTELPYLEDFRLFVLRQHGIIEEKKLICDHLNILVIFRRDYIAHPRNPKGKVTRKIKNETELLDTIKFVLPGHNVRGLQLDLLSMGHQLKVISNTDILVGMHGAGLTHTLFLPRHAGLVELFPYYMTDKHFRRFAARRQLKYLSWRNNNYKKELPDHYTAVDANDIAEQIMRMKMNICS